MFNNYCTCLLFLAVSRLDISDIAVTINITLTWPSSMIETDDTAHYEVGYIARPDDKQCTTTSTSANDNASLPIGYTVFSITTDTTVTVTSLQPGTCYVFGVRVHTIGAGEWTVLLQQAITGTCMHEI